MTVYQTSRGIVFRAEHQLVDKYSPQLIAEVGDIINVDGHELQNITRACHGDPSVRFHVRRVEFVEPRVS